MSGIVYINIMCCFFREHRKSGCDVWFGTLLSAKGEVLNQHKTGFFVQVLTSLRKGTKNNMVINIPSVEEVV